MQTQQTPEKQIELLSGQLSTLKVRLFDANEELNAERAHVSQFVNMLAQILEIKGDDAAQLQNYIDAVQALKLGTAPTDAETDAEAETVG